MVVALSPLDITPEFGLPKLSEHVAMHLVKFGKLRHLGSEPHFPEFFQSCFLPNEDFSRARQILAAKLHLLPDRFDQIPKF